MIPIIGPIASPGQVISIAGTFSAADNGGSYSETEIPALPQQLKDCDGSQISDSDSPFNTQFVPKVDDTRFLRGSASGGGKKDSSDITPSVDLAETGDYTPTGNAVAHLHSMNHTHLSNTTGQANQANVQVGPGGLDNLIIDTHTHQTNNHVFNGNTPNDAITFSPSSTPTLASWFKTSGVKVAPKEFQVRLLMRIK